MDSRDKLIQIVRMKGPLLPSQINREMNTNLLFASAMLSELVDKKVLKISRVKVGGSPVYYYPGQEARLQDYAKKLNEKDYRAYELLRQAKVLRDKDQEPLVRACLREIKDFAVPLEVNFEGSAELFWKWYLLSNEEIEPLVRQCLGLDVPRQQPALEQSQTIPSSAPQADPLLDRKMALTRKVLMDKEEPKVQEKQKERETRKPEEKSVKKEAERSMEKAKKPEETPLSQETFVDRGEPNDKFFRRVKAFFDENKIRILSCKVLRKESDIEFTVEIPSNVGKLVYFCKAKDKQKCNDGDLSSAYVQSQSRKLPILFMTTGELTKKAQDILRNEFKSMTVRRL